MRKIKKSFSALIVVFAMIMGIVIQSCQTEDINFIEPEQKAILNSFEKLVERTASNLQGVSERSVNLSNAKSASSKKEFQKMEIQVENELSPLVESSKNLLSAYGITDEYLKQEFENPDDPRIALAGILILAASKETKNIQTASFGDFSLSHLMAINTANAEMDNDRIWSCVKSALGITAIRTLINSTTALGTAQTALQIVKHLGLRYLGYIGVAVAVYNFVDCVS